ncbi:unnamed protein product [Enterobius vermicularis]|uniref:protein-disulfide reductase n=1 Tax=Enterobius vermicularis TaxID=51028 RepID=A0A0N4VBZ3_ENTVE|nr:unnamed protein product [Enterobius vermicularis]
MALRLLTGNSRTLLYQSCRAYAAGSDFLKEVNLRNKSGEVFASAFEGKAVLLYFSAGWCGQCRLFTPKLKKWFEEAGKPNGVELIWISRDRSAEDLAAYHKKALPEISYIPFGDPSVRKFLQKYQIKTIPSLFLVNNEGEIVDRNVKTRIETEGKENPKKLAKDLRDAA